MGLTHMSLFTGIGGIDLAAEWAGFKTIGQVEIDDYATKVLDKHWPDVARFGDVRGVTGETINELVAYAERVSVRAGLCEDEPRGERRGRSGDGDCARLTVLSGGFPCQPFSTAGKRQGTLDSRNLWPEFRRLIGEARPRWVVAENVPGLFSIDSGRVFGEVVADLAEMGYSVGWSCYGAVDVGAPHRRNRVFIVAHTKELPGDGVGDSGTDQANDGINRLHSQDRGSGGIMADTKRGAIRPGLCKGIQGEEWWGRLGDGGVQGKCWAVEPSVGRVAHGVPSRVDRLKCLGNAVVPQQIYEVFRGIAEHELTYLDRSPII
jgi:DNA (cytosine-5)-methyltransferase 1